MENTISLFDLIMNFLFMACNIFSVLGAGLLAYHRVRPQFSWHHFLTFVWFVILGLSALALTYLLKMYSMTVIEAREITY